MTDHDAQSDEHLPGGQTSAVVPPHSLEAERSVLGALLLAHDEQRSALIDDVSAVMQPEDLYHERHRLIYEAILQQVARNEPFDTLLVAERLQAEGSLEKAGGAHYLAEIFAAVPHTGHARYYAGIVADKAARRRLITASLHTVEQARNETRETSEVLAESEGSLHELLERQSGSTGQIDLGAILVETLDRLQSGQVAGLPTGYQDLEQLTTGWHDGTLTILAARPSMGKTALALNLIHRVITAGHCVLLISLEQSSLELTERLLAMESGISTHRLRSGALPETETQQVLQSSSTLSDLPLFIDDRARQTTAGIAVQARIHKRRHNLRLLVIDYLQLIQPRDKRLPREQQVAEIARELKALSRDLEIPVLALAQLNRLVETRGDKRPQLSDLRESGSIEQDADLVMFVHRPAYFDEQADPAESELLVRKHRNGPTGLVRLHWQADTMRFEPAAHPHQTEAFGNVPVASPPAGGGLYGEDF